MKIALYCLFLWSESGARGRRGGVSGCLVMVRGAFSLSFTACHPNKNSVAAAK